MSSALHWLFKAFDVLVVIGMAVISLLIFTNVVLRYGFGSGIAASEELSRLLFVWMVFIGATAAYPRGELMAFTMLLAALRKKPLTMKVLTIVIRVLTILACVLLARGAWQQVVVGLDSHSVVMRYPTALLPLPAFLCSSAIGVMALVELLRNRPIHLGHAADTAEAE